MLGGVGCGTRVLLGGGRLTPIWHSGANWASVSLSILQGLF